MEDLNDERVMTDFLLGGLDEKDRGRLFHRLETDEAFFESMAALEDDLILRWHRGGLSAMQRKLFARAFAEPARRARVDAAAALLHAAETWKRRDAAGVGQRIAQWVRTPWTVPRFALAATGVALVAVLALSAYVANRRLRESTRPGDAPGQATSPSGPIIVAFTLTAIGEKGVPIPRGFDSIVLPRNATAVQLTVEPSNASGDGLFTAEIVAVDSGTTLHVEPPKMSRSATGQTLTVTVATRDLPDGDYVLTVRRVAAGTSGVVARQSFRVTRQRN